MQRTDLNLTQAKFFKNYTVLFNLFLIFQTRNNLELCIKILAFHAIIFYTLK